jgi:hypothetical protein
MNHSNSIWTFVLIILSGLTSSCGKDDATSLTVSGQIIDAFTSEPVADVEVSILENGPTTIADSNGNFEFTSEELASIGIEEIMSTGFSGVAVSLAHPNYRPREANVNYDQKTTLKLTESTFPSYVYHQPVQLNDGINVATLADVNMDISQLHSGMENLFQNDYKEIHSVLIFKDDHLVLEEYLFGNNDTIQFENGIVVDRTPEHIQWSRTEKHYVASVNKALTSTLVGIALDQYAVPVDGQIATYLPAYASYFEDPNKAALTFEDCLTMTSGYQWDEWGDNDLAVLWKSEDFAEFLFNRTNFGPGFEWRYNSALPNVLIKSIDNMVGGNVREWAHQNFYEKLGIEDYNWQSQPDGYPEGAARMFIRSRDMLKIGITYLNNGMWNGTQVIPQNWVNECFQLKESTSSGDYSYYFWLRSMGDVHYLSADGDGGNYINIFPEQNMVIVVTQGNYLKWPFYVSQAEDLIENYILPSIGE